jgi:hypothetical protein
MIVYYRGKGLSNLAKKLPSRTFIANNTIEMHDKFIYMTLVVYI